MPLRACGCAERTPAAQGCATASRVITASPVKNTASIVAEEVVGDVLGLEDLRQREPSAIA